MCKDLLIIENISKTFTVDKNKELKALKNINIRLKKGECIGQAIFQKYFLSDDDNAEGERTGGFGSTNK